MKLEPKFKKLKLSKKEVKSLAKSFIKEQRKDGDEHVAIIFRNGRKIELRNTNEDAIYRDVLTINRLEVENDRSE